MTPHVACVLLREQLLPRLATLPTAVAREAAIHEAGEARPVTRVMELVAGAMGGWEAHRYDWYLHGTPTGQDAPRVRPLADQNQIRYEEGLTYVEQLARAYAWCLLPWGVDYTGVMLLLLATDAMTFTTLLTWLQGGYGHAYEELLVSAYTPEAFHARHFRGAIFSRANALRGHGLWQAGRGSTASVLLFSIESAEYHLILPACAEVVYQTHGRSSGRERRTWLRVHDEAALLATLPAAAMLVAGDLDDQWMRQSLGHFPQVAARIGGDPFYFGLNALQSASWMYIPDTARERWEIYLNHDPAVTRQLLQCIQQRSGTGLLHKHFC